jgi:cell division protein FtsW
MNREDSAVSVRTPEAQAEQKTAEESSSALRKGSVDIVFLLITSALVLFGCVMVYSASSVFAEQHHDTTTYFITRHLIFLLMAVAFTAVIVRFCTPAFWRDFSYPIFGVAILMLLAVLVVGSDLGSGAKRWLDL